MKSPCIKGNVYFNFTYWPKEVATYDIDTDRSSTLFDSRVKWETIDKISEINLYWNSKTENKSTESH